MTTMTRTQAAQNLTLVLGATGTTGRRVAERLVTRGVPIRLGSRSGQPPCDWQDTRYARDAAASGVWDPA